MDHHLKAIEERMNRLQDTIQNTHENESITMVKENDLIQSTREMYTSSIHSSVKLKKFDRTSMKQLQTEPLIPKQINGIIKNPMEIILYSKHSFDYIDKKPILIQNNNPFNL